MLEISHRELVARRNAEISVMMVNIEAVRAAQTHLPVLPTEVTLFDFDGLRCHKSHRCGDYCYFCFQDACRLLGPERIAHLDSLLDPEEIPL